MNKNLMNLLLAFGLASFAGVASGMEDPAKNFIEKFTNPMCDMQEERYQCATLLNQDNKPQRTPDEIQELKYIIGELDENFFEKMNLLASKEPKGGPATEMLNKKLKKQSDKRVLKSQKKN